MQLRIVQPRRRMTCRVACNVMDIGRGLVQSSTAHPDHNLDSLILAFYLSGGGVLGIINVLEKTSSPRECWYPSPSMEEVDARCNIVVDVDIDDGQG